MNRDEVEAAHHAAFLDKQERVFHRRQQAWEKYVSAGRTCRLEKCGFNSKDHAEFEAHLLKHKEDLKRRLICNQEECGAQMENQKAWQEHVEVHKTKLMAKIINSVRSVLLYNKHGLVMDAFMKEYREACGRPLPFKLFGYTSAYDFLGSLKDVVEVQQVGGHMLLVGKPDKNTEHMASLVSRQLDNRSGYNVLTGKVLQAFGMAESSGVEVEKSLRRVSKHLLNQLKELLELRGALPLIKLHGEYEEEFGYKLEWRNLGFSCLEDLFTSDVEAVALFRLVPELHGWVVMLKEEGCEDYSSFRRNVLVPKSVQESLRTLLLARPQGVALSALSLVFSQFGELLPEQYGCRNLLELCLSLPHICYVHALLQSECQSMEQEHWVCAAVYHCSRSNRRCAVAVTKEQRGMCVPSKVEKISKEESTAEKDNEGTLGTSVHFVELKENVAKVLENSTGGILKSAFDSVYEKVIGQKLEARRFGFFNTNALLRSLQGDVVDLKVSSGSKEVMVFSHNE